MKALLLIAHGSRKVEANEEVRKLTEKLGQMLKEDFGVVECGFLELAEPSIPDGIECCIRQGASEVSVLPYFLVNGKHVARDIPEEVEKKQKEHPGCKILLLPYLGAEAALAEMIAKKASE